MPLARFPTPNEARAPLSGPVADAFVSLRRELGVPDAYPRDAASEAEESARSVPVDPANAALPDLRDIELLTIDPAGSTDLDQALHLQRTGDGAVLHYAIADVPAYVTPHGALDAETRQRGQTLYAPDGRVPLHPSVIGEGAASLLPGADRRAFVWRFVLDNGARPVETTLTRAIVRSRRQWSYPEAHEAIRDGSAPQSLAALRWFGDRRRDRERERGGASLNLPQQLVERDAAGYRLTLDAPTAIENDNAQLSLLAGMAAAQIMLDGGVGILRTMPPPSSEAVEEFRVTVDALGVPWPADEAYGSYLARLDDSAAALAVREQAAALFRGAEYAAFDGAPPALTVQAAIGAPYAHTTAPLRRLVDRFVLVICHALANDLPIPAWARSALPELPAAMARSGRLAGRLDRGIVDRVGAAVLESRIGERFEAVVIDRRDAAGSSARVRIAAPPVTANAETHAPIGSSIHVRLTHASITEGTVQFEQVEPNADLEPPAA